HDGEQAYYVSDTSLAEMALALSATSPALLTFDTAGAPHGHALKGVVTLTDAGRSVLTGQIDRVATCGIDRWFGGVHVVSGFSRTGGGGNGRIWRWDETNR